MTRSGRNTGRYTRYRGWGPVGRPASGRSFKARIGVRKVFQWQRMPFDLAAKLWRTTKRPYAAMPHPTKSGPGRM